MPLFKYFISQDPTGQAPPNGKLFFQEAQGRSEVIDHLVKRGELPTNWQTMWIHFLVWEDAERGQRGFESLPLSRFSGTST